MNRTLLGLLLSLTLPFSSYATSAYDSKGLPVPGEQQVTFNAKLSPQTIHPGEHFRFEIDVATETGWHIYSVFPAPEEDAPPPTKVQFKAPDLIFNGPLYETRPIVEYDKVIQLTLSSHEHRAVLYQNFQAPPTSTTGLHTIKAQVSYQVCSFRVCLPPKKAQLTADYHIEAGPVRPEYNFPVRTVDPLPGNQPQGGSKQLGSEGFWAFIGLAALMGLAGLIMPCVFPMIPITISYFSKQAEGNPAGVFRLATLFGLGIVITYTGTGLLLSSLFGAGAAQVVATNPWVNLAIASLFIVFALSLIGFFAIQLPSSLQTFVDRKARDTGGAVGVILMGFTFTLTAFTCTVQFVGTLMIAASQGEWLWPLIGMLVFSAVFAFPFFLLALMPSLIGKMQKSSGQWIGHAKVILGILELMASLKFLSNADLVLATNLLSRDRALWVWIFCLLAATIYLAVVLFRQHRKINLQWIWVGFFLGLAILTAQGLGGRSLNPLIDSILPPSAGSTLAGAEYVSKAQANALTWHPTYEQAQAEALKTGKPIFIEFTGYTCVNCRWMEQNILPLKEVHQLLSERYTLARLYTDGGDFQQQNMDLQINRFKTVALPLYVILTPGGKEMNRYIGVALTPNQFKAFLSQEAQGLKPTSH